MAGRTKAPLTPIPTYQYVKQMMTLDRAVQNAINQAPGSIRELGRAAGVSHVFLAGVLSGRERATPRVARLIATALEAWEKRCAAGATVILSVLEGP